MRVVYGTLTHGAPRIEWVAGAVLLFDYERGKGDECLLVDRHFAIGPYIHKNRAAIVQKMYARAADATFMVDHDVFTPPETLEKMVATMTETGAGVVAADLVLGQDAPTTGFMADRAVEGRFVVTTAPEGKAVGRVDTIASSCVLVHRRVYDAISSHRDDPPYYGPGTWWMHWPIWDEREQMYVTLGEDFSFSRRVTEVGEAMVVRYDLGLEHWKVGRMMPRPQKEE